MTLITPEKDPTPITEEIDAVKRQMRDMRNELNRLQQAVMSGEFEGMSDARKIVNELRQWLRSALETEQDIERRRKAAKGIVHDYAFDFERARVDIGCKLDRLRTRGCPRRFS